MAYSISSLFLKNMQAFQDKVKADALIYSKEWFGKVHKSADIIDELNLEITDEIIARTLEMQNIDTYNYLCNLGYTPEGESLKASVKMCYSGTVDSILSENCDLIDVIAEDDIDFLFSEDIDEETVETLRVLLNYNVNHNLFRQHLADLLENKDKLLEEADGNEGNDSSAYGDNCNEECDITLEIIDLLSGCNINFD